MKDHVDVVIGQWHRAMPELDASSMKIFGRMLRLIKHLGKARARALAPFGFRDGEFDVLATLRRAGEPYCLSPTQLYTSLLVTSGAMTHRLNHLEQQGLIARLTDPDDKRSTLVSLTATGRERIEAALVVHTATQESILQPLSGPERQQLESLLRTLLLTFPAETRAESA
ncbi:MarR family winged helix-turn-helix transcriptional regulator [Cronobacter dublinensis]|uniref:MarR family winged helix-turn-helix transcriptional regulator n=1 Tax=Cronobacter dublinensis TaxID=413497 RepID=UPI00029C2915|nr:MarR family transcriptional regulator [Cronobacter dublinensis]CCJ84926.1 Transcriptional regulator, MarR family [Cronobacter dublinensis 582]EMD9245821.1 MarR family transcriptional regulator [Cronobacter dublinensis]MDI6442884.1 MarR family transcriptional regulator [Cronobacter dublinensis]MDI6445153.1 MarR family transcriptional regulator [Cronobacter dublinensis]NCH95665.1 MarR family transcriptional regulator [Cronobacter dublinensis]